MEKRTGRGRRDRQTDMLSSAPMAPLTGFFWGVPRDEENGRGKRHLHFHPAERKSGSRTKEHMATSPRRQDAGQNNEGEGEARVLDKAIFVYQVLLPGASAREARSGAKGTTTLPAPSLQEPSLIQNESSFLSCRVAVGPRCGQAFPASLDAVHKFWSKRSIS